MKHIFSSFFRPSVCAALFAAVSTSALSAQVGTADGVKVLSKVSPALQVSDDLGAVNGDQPIHVTVHLRSGNGTALKAAVDDLYNPNSSHFHQWMSDAELAQYAPTQEQAQVVRKALEAHGLTVVPGQNNLSLRASGTAAAVQAAFNTQLHQFRHGSVTFRANITPARLDGEADQYVSSIAGLESHTVRPMLKMALDPKTKKALTPITLSAMAAAGGIGSVISDQALLAPKTFELTTPGAALPVGVYYGNHYNTNSVVDFTAAQLQSVYGLTPVYAKGLNGSGQTVVLLEAYGDSHIETDANDFSAAMGLPALTSSTFSIVYPDGPPKNGDEDATLTGWDTEIALDVEWAHAIAPGAKIVVVAAAGQDNEDFQSAMQYIVTNRIGYAVSDSWEVDTDLIAGPVEQTSFEDVLTLAAAKGISFHFSSGDSGDEGLGTPVGAPGVPSDAPHATAIGGTTILNNISGSGFQTLGWGDTFTLLDDAGVLDPPMVLGLVGGAGGGESTFFAKPSWQKALPGTGRQVPDISALADPYTGVPIVISVAGTPEFQLGVGGTSLASPIFTAFWAIGQQMAGGPLGQAAPLLAALPAGVLQDVLPVTSPTNPTGTIVDANGAYFLSASDLFQGALDNTTNFVSAIANESAPGTKVYYDFGFGIDSSLTVTQGWDNVTGLGTINGAAFISALKAAATAKK